MYIAAVVGRKKSGKTSLIVDLVKHFSKHYKVAVIKHVHHKKGLEIDKEGRDTWKFKKAGAKTVIGISPDQLYINSDYYDEDPIKILNMLQNQFMKYDLVLIEGFLNIVKNLPDVDIIFVSNDPKKDVEIINELIDLRGGKNNIYIFCRDYRDVPLRGLRVFRNIFEIEDFISEVLLKSK